MRWLLRLWRRWRERRFTIPPNALTVHHPGDTDGRTVAEVQKSDETVRD